MLKKFIIIGGVVILVAALLITLFLWCIEQTSKECAQRCERNDTPHIVVVHESDAHTSAPLLQYSHMHPLPACPYQFMQPQAIHASREPPPSYSAVMGDQQLFPYTETTTAQQTLAA